MPILSRLAESRARITQQGSTFVEQTKDASTSFFVRTRTAATSFANETRVAGVSCVEQTRAAGEAFAKGVRSEVESLRHNEVDEAGSSDDAGATGSARRSFAPAALPRTLEKRLLVGLRPALRRVDAALENRLEKLEEQGFAEESLVEPPPVAGYDEMNAKAAVLFIEQLPIEQAQALLDYETKHKNRSSVLKALERRLH